MQTGVVTEYFDILKQMVMRFMSRVLIDVVHRCLFHVHYCEDRLESGDFCIDQAIRINPAKWWM
jgi:hypothetical protein